MNTLTDIGAFLLFSHSPYPFCWTLSLSRRNRDWFICVSFSCVHTVLRVSHVKVLFLWLMCHSELFCGQLSTVPWVNFRSAKAELILSRGVFLTFQHLIENTFWGFNTGIYTRIKERSHYIGSHLGKCWIIEKWNESVHRRSCCFGRWHGRLRISKFSHWGGEAEDGSYSALIVYWGGSRKRGFKHSDVWGWLSWLQGTPVRPVAHP